jgi:hypothetical protein
MAYQLTEDNIKHATLGFLKTYYKNNSSRGFGDSLATLNMKTGKGIIADGYLKFSLADNPMKDLSADKAEKAFLKNKGKTDQNEKSFLATFEATSQSTAEEIQYRVQNTLLFFDALAIASMVAAGSYGYNFMNDQFTLNELGVFKFFAGFFAVLLVSMVLYILFFRNLPRYRYIYAIAQFKKYHADEQWISYGCDVFANADNKYFLELRKQCIRQGFGLISVNELGQPNLVITPARENKFGFRRKAKDFFETKTADNKAFKWINGIKMPKIHSPIDAEDYERYTKSYWKQAIIIGVMCFAMGEIYLEELKNPNIVYMNEAEYEAKIKEAMKDNQPEPREYQEEDRVENDASEKTRKREVLTEKGKGKQALQIPPKKSPPLIATQKNALIISTGIKDYITYDCRRLSALKGNHFLVEIATAYNTENAIQKMTTFNENGFRTNALWLGCFTNKKEYVVYLDDIFNNKNAAVQRATKFQKLMSARNEKTEVLIRMIKGAAQ